MNKEEIIELAEGSKLIEFHDLECKESSATWIFDKEELLAFAKAIQDKQRERDAEYIRSFGYGITGDMFDKLADAILENKE